MKLCLLLWLYGYLGCVIMTMATAPGPLKRKRLKVLITALFWPITVILILVLSFAAFILKGRS